MKKLIALLLLICLTASAETDVQFTISDFTSTPMANRNVWVQAMSMPTVNSASILLGDIQKYVSDANGQFTVSNMNVSLYLCQIKAPPTGGQQTSFKIYVTSTNLGFVSAQPMLVADSTATFPAGTVAWSAASSDLRYAAFGTAGVAIAAGTNVIAVTNGSVVTISSTGGGGSNVAAGTNIVGVTNGSTVVLSASTNLATTTNLVTTSNVLASAIALKANIDQPTFTTKIVISNGAHDVVATPGFTGGASTLIFDSISDPGGTVIAAPHLSGGGEAVTAIDTNNITGLNALIAALYPRSNPSNFVTSIVTNGLASTNSVNQLIATSGVEYSWTNVTPNSATAEGRINQGSYTAYYHAIGTTPGAWNANTMFNGPVLIGSQYWMSNYPSSSSALNIWHGGSPDFFGTNGSAALSELAEIKNLGDGRQGYYANYAVPIGATATNWIMSSPQHMQIGAIGYLYGSNTLAGMTLTPGLVSAIDAGYNWYLTSTVDRGIYGTRLVAGFDNSAQIFYIGDDIVGNGSFGMTGFKSLATFDAGNHKIYFTNGLTTLKDVTVTGIGAFSGTNITIGNSGTANIANGSFARMTLNAGGGSVCTPSLGLNGFGIDSPSGSTAAFGFCFNTITTNIWIDRVANSMYFQNAVAIGSSNNLPNVTNIFEANALGGKVNVGTNGVLYGNATGLTNINGVNISSGTINSNALDAPTKAQLALAGTGGSGSSITNTFDTNQFSAVNGTNIHIVSGVLTTNLHDKGSVVIDGTATFVSGHSGVGSGGVFFANLGNASSDTANFIAGGSDNTMDLGTDYAIIAGGIGNTMGVNDDNCIIVGGQANIIGAASSFGSIFGGQGNSISNRTIGGSSFVTIIGGISNIMSGDAFYSTIIGSSNLVTKPYSFAVGQRAKSTNQGTFVWSDSQGSDFTTVSNDTFIVRATNGVGINTNSGGGFALNVNGSENVTGNLIVNGTITGNGSGIATSNGFGTNTTILNLTNDFITASTGTWSLLGSNGNFRMLFNSTAFQIYDGVMATARENFSGTGDVIIRNTNGAVGWRFGKDGDFTVSGNSTLSGLNITNTATIGSVETNLIKTAYSNGVAMASMNMSSNQWSAMVNGTNEFKVQQGGVMVPGSLTMGGGASITAGTNFTAAKPALDMRVGAGALGVYGGNGGIGDYMGFALAGTAKILFAGGMMLSARNYSIGWQSSINAGAGADASMTSTAAGSVTITTNLIVPGTITATNGVTSLRSNLVAPSSITFPATTVNWTNTNSFNIQVYIDNSAVTGTAIKKNGGTIFTSITGDATIGLQPNETFSETYTVGTPTATWSPF